MNRSALPLVLALMPLECTSSPTSLDGGHDLFADASESCLDSTPPTQLYQSPCIDGTSNFCLIDQPPTVTF